MRRNIAKSILIIVFAGLILITLSRILILKSEDGISQLKSFYKQDENSIDVLFLGSSHVYCDISTGLLWDEYGMASYDLGGAEAAAFSSYYHLKEALKTQRPKVILYEISIAALRQAEFPPEFWVEDNNYGIKWNDNRIKQLEVNTTDDMFKKLILPLGTMHGRYNNLSEDDFVDIHNSKNYKGFDPRETTTPFEKPDISSVTDRMPIPEKHEKYYRMIIDLCKEENIPLVLFVSPYVVSAEEEAMYNYMFDIGESEGCICIDFNRLYDEFGMDFATDMAEELHLNYSGNYKFTKYIGKLIKDSYDIADRRGQAGYESWDVDALNQRIERSDLEMVFNRSDEYWLGRSSDRGYVSFIVFSQNGEEIADDARRGYFASLGIDLNKVAAGDAYICKDGTIIDSFSGGKAVRLSTTENNNGLLLIEEGVDDGIHTIALHVSTEVHEEDYGNIIFVYNSILGRYIGSYRF